MPFDFNNVIKKQYTTVPVRKDQIATTGVPSPQILWVGCSDSFIVETESLGVLPEEIFVHRNLGNIMSNGDLSSMSALEWAVDLLKVKHLDVEMREGKGDKMKLMSGNRLIILSSVDTMTARSSTREMGVHWEDGTSTR
jgi:hypothetical protein